MVRAQRHQRLVFPSRAASDLTDVDLHQRRRHRRPPGLLLSRFPSLQRQPGCSAATGSQLPPGSHACGARPHEIEEGVRREDGNFGENRKAVD
ncbi:hypothetical protein E2562_017999, partial [Oryza meyeriana var. granulata]